MPQRISPKRWGVGPLRFFAPLAGMVVGCARPDVSRPEQMERGCVFMVPGIEGTAWHLRGSVRGLRTAGVDRQIEIVEWGKRPFRQFHNLCALNANRLVAKEIAERIGRYHTAHPEAPVTLVGYSGGGGIAVMAAERLPDEVKLDRLILVGAAVSPRYDLSSAMAHTRGEIINFYSQHDWLILGAGTSLFGTIDRVRTSSAGRVGFRDADGELAHAEGLTQIGWRREWLDLGHLGGHIGWLSSAWARDVLAPEIVPALHREHATP